MPDGGSDLRLRGRVEGTVQGWFEEEHLRTTWWKQDPEPKFPGGWQMVVLVSAFLLKWSSYKLSKRQWSNKLNKLSNGWNKSLKARSSSQWPSIYRSKEKLQRASQEWYAEGRCRKGCLEEAWCNAADKRGSENEKELSKLDILAAPIEILQLSSLRRAQEDPTL